MSTNYRMFRLIAFLVFACICDPVLADKDFFVGFAQDTLGNDWRLTQVMEVKQELDKHPNIRFIYTDGKGDTALQAKHIEDLAAMGVDLLITSPRDKTALSGIISKVHQSGIPVVLLSRGVEGNGYTTYIHPDDTKIGTSAAEYLAKRLHGRGHILMLEGVPRATTTIQRGNSFLTVMEQYPDIQITRRVGNYLRGDAILAVESLLAQGFCFDAIFAQSDSMATGARMALRHHGIESGTIPIVGIDYISEARQAIRQGEQAISFTYPTGGTEGAQAAVKILNGEQVHKEMILKSIRVSRENVDSVEPIF